MLQDLFFYVHVTVHRNKFLFNKTNRRTNFPNLFCQKILHVSGSSSAHHQEFSTVHSALVYVIKTAWRIPLPNVHGKTPNDGQSIWPKHVDFLDKHKFGKLVGLLVLLKIIFCGCCELSGRVICDGAITRPEESYQVWVSVWVSLWSGWTITSTATMST